jgi:hypothetical protein
MKKLTLASAILAAFAGSVAHAEEAAPAPDHVVSFNVGATSDYRFRGISQSRGDPAVFAGVDYTHTPSGLYVGAWTSTIKWVKDAGASSGSYELDIYGGKRGQFGRQVGEEGHVLVGADEMHASSHGTRDQRILRRIARRHHQIITVARGAQPGQLRLDRAEGAGRIGQHHHGAALRAEGLQGGDRGREGGFAIVQAAPKVAEDRAVILGDFGKRGDQRRHRGPFRGLYHRGRARGGRRESASADCGRQAESPAHPNRRARG